MKKYLLKLTSLCLFVGVLSSCEQEKIIYDVNNGQSFVGFNIVSASLPTYSADSGTDFTLEVEVGATTKANHDRTIAIAINDKFTTALPTEYTIDQASLVIPANKFVGTIKITGNYANLPASGQKLITLDLVSVQDADVINPDKKSFTVYLYRACPVSIPLNYTGVSSYSSYTSQPFDVVFTPVVGVDNSWKADNLWGNFVAALTGSSKDEGKSPYPGSIKINCDNTVTVTGTGASGDGGTGTFNPTTKVITFSLNQTVFSNPFTASVKLTPKQ